MRCGEEGISCGLWALRFVNARAVMAWLDRYAYLYLSFLAASQWEFQDRGRFVVAE